MSKIKLWVGGIFLSIGLIFACIGGGIYYSDQQLEAKGGQATGTVVAFSRHRNRKGTMQYGPEVEFLDQNGTLHRFTSNVSSNSPNVAHGDKVNVIYDPQDPSDALIDSFLYRHLLTLIFGIMGSIFIIAGGFFLLGYWRRKQAIKRLHTSGLRIEALFTRCYADTSIKLNGRSPYVVEAQAQHPMTGKLTSFTSEPIWLNLTGVLIGQKVPVLLNPNQTDEHLIDLRQWVDANERA